MLTTIKIALILSTKSKVIFVSGTKLSNHEPFKSFSRSLGNYISDNWMILLWSILLLIAIMAICPLISLRTELENRVFKRSVMAISTFLVIWLSAGVYMYSNDMVKYVPWGTHKLESVSPFKRTIIFTSNLRDFPDPTPAMKTLLLRHTMNTCPTDSMKVDSAMTKLRPND